MNAFDRFALTTRAFFREVLGSPAPRGISPSPKLNRTGPLPVDMLVIDVSLSMDLTDYPPSRLDGAKQAATRFLVKRFEVSPAALVGIATFCSRAKLVSDPVPISQNLVQLQGRLQGLSTGSATNLSAGLSMAQTEILKARSTETKRIVLLTDGDSNTGPNPVITSDAIKKAGIQLDIIGIGGSPSEVNEKDLKRMASVVNGELRYWFIKSVGELVQRFETLALREIK